MAKKVIFAEAFFLHCDACGFEELMPDVTAREQRMAKVGHPCPKCAANMLTQSDADEFEKIMATQDAINALADAMGVGYETSEEAGDGVMVKIHQHDGTTKIEVEG